ncbi:spexin prohormone 1-like [Gadus chalcogrammus]|uniref:spexin prohormone 1-like n=1 Tax=Gadus chalcogrammus TaxID=1042646 RepID=UPI0024C4DD28|nr:spexin prohormone 1-like [Gadus chalcogrammus]
MKSALMVPLLLASLVSNCWTARQWRNWPPQAMLYLKGATAHRPIMQRSGREDVVQPVKQSWNRNTLSMFHTSSVLLDMLHSKYHKKVEKTPAG